MFNRDRWLKVAFVAPIILAAIFIRSDAQVSNSGAQLSGAITFGDCVKMGPGTGQISDAGAGCATQSSGANPTATAGSVAINGAATTFMRSDAAPAVALGTSSTFGVVKCDGTTITCGSSVFATPGAANPSATAGTSAINGTATTFMRSDAAPAVGVITFAGQTAGPGQSATMQGNGAKIQAATGTFVSQDCLKYDVNGNAVDNGAVCGGAAGANPTATAGSAAINGVATTFMRSDAAPAVALGTSSTFGLVKCDNVTITCGSSVVATAARASFQSSNAGINPVGTTSSTEHMAGIGSTCTITPTTTGNVIFEITGNFTLNGAQNGQGALYEGTGTAPTNGAVTTGTKLTVLYSLQDPLANEVMTFSMNALKTGLTLNTAVWFDISQLSVNNTASFTYTNLMCNAHEF